MYKPVFPYLGNQAIITSGRVVIHSDEDFIFLFGKKGVSISSPSTFTVDANEKTTIASPLVELGYNARNEGQQLLLGRSTVFQLSLLLDQISETAEALSGLSEKNLASSLPRIVASTKVLAELSKVVKNQLNTNCLSKTTYTK